MKNAEFGLKKGGTAMSWLQKPESARSRERIPPGQTLTTKFPILHISEPPVFNPQTWTLKVVGEVEQPLTLSWEQVLVLPSITSISDFHCVTSWSRLDNCWEGVAFRTLAKLAQPGEQLYGIQHSNAGKVVIFGGGIPVRTHRRIIGAVGTSAGTVEQDIAVAEAAIAALVPQDRPEKVAP